MLTAWKQQWPADRSLSTVLYMLISSNCYFDWFRWLNRADLLPTEACQFFAIFGSRVSAYLRHRNYTSTSSLGAMSSCPAFGKFARGRADHTKSAQCDRKTSSTWSRVPWPSILVLESRSLTLVSTSLEPRINWQIKKYSTVLISTTILCGLCRIFYSTVQYMYCNLFLAGMCCHCFTAPFMGRGEHIINQVEQVSKRFWTRGLPFVRTSMVYGPTNMKEVRWRHEDADVTIFCSRKS